jgi:GNAT superfamily N-acetyltransferase
VQTAIRRAGPADAIDIANVHVSSWKSTYPGVVAQSYIDSLDPQQFASQWTDRLSLPDTLVLIAATAEGVCGFVSGGPLREPLPSPAPPCDGEVYALYVLQQAQRHGVGRALMGSVAQSLIDAGYAHAAVWVLEENPSRLFYSRLGGHPVAKQTIAIGGDELIEVAYVWDSLKDLIRS